MKDIIMSNYWVDRFTAEENRINELSKEQVKEAKKQYDIALKNTNQKIYEFFAESLFSFIHRYIIIFCQYMF